MTQPKQYCRICHEIVAQGDPEAKRTETTAMHGDCWRSEQRRQLGYDELALIPTYRLDVVSGNIIVQ